MRKSILLWVLAFSAPALAETRDSLEGQPAVRQRKDLRAGRFELGPMLGFTFLQPYRHTAVGGVKVDYHLADSLSVGAVGVFGLAKLKTGLTNEVADAEQAQVDSPQCGGDTDCGRIPNEDGVRWDDAQNSLKFAASFRVTLTPFAGKLALFSSLFAPFDLYFFGGAGVLGFKNGAGNPDPSCAPACDGELGNDGISVGPNFGGGIHVFFSQWAALDYEFSDTMAGNNPSGRNTNESSGVNVVNADDKRFGHNMLMMLGISFYLPVDAPRTK